MAKVKEEKHEDVTRTVPAVIEDGREVEPYNPTRKLKMAPVELIEAGSITAEQLAGLPAEFNDAETLAGFPPSPVWTKRGQYIFGTFVQTREKVGPNGSRLYEVAVDGGKEGEPKVVSVWGSDALDRLMDQAAAQQALHPGARIAITFLGAKPTSRGLNPVKVFALTIKQADAHK